MIRILLVDRDAARLDQTKQYLQNFEDFRIFPVQFDDEAAYELKKSDIDVIYYTMSEHSSPESIFDDESNPVYLMIIKGDISCRRLHLKFPGINIKYADDFDNNSSDLAETIRTYHNIHNIEKNLFNGINKYKRFFLNAPVPFAILNKSEKMLHVNYEWTRILQFERDEISGSNLSAFVQNEDSERLKNYILSAGKKLQSERQTGIGTVLIKKGGQRIPVRLFITGIYDEYEKTERLLCTFTDLTSENASIKSLNFKSRLFDAVGSCVPSLLHSKSVTDDISNIIHIFGVALNASRVSVFFTNKYDVQPNVYIKKSEWISNEIKDISENSELLKFSDIFNIFSNNNLEKNLEKPLVFISGNCDENVQYILDKCSTQSLLCIPISLDNSKNAVMLIEDCINKRKWDNDEIDAIIIASHVLGMILRLKHIELKNLSIIDNSPDLVGIADQNGKIIYANSTVNRLLKIYENKKDQSIITDIFQNKNRLRLIAQINKAVINSKPVAENYNYFYQNNEYFTNLLIFPIKKESGKEEIIFFGRDLTKRKEFEERLLLTQFAVESSPDSVIYTNDSGKIIYANKTACNLLNYKKTELLDMSFPKLCPQSKPDTWKNFWNELKKTGSLRYKTVLKGSDEKEVCADVAAGFLFINEKEISCFYLREILN